MCFCNFRVWKLLQVRPANIIRPDITRLLVYQLLSATLATFPVYVEVFKYNVTMTAVGFSICRLVVYTILHTAVVSVNHGSSYDCKVVGWSVSWNMSMASLLSLYSSCCAHNHQTVLKHQNETCCRVLVQLFIQGSLRKFCSGRAGYLMARHLT